MLVTELLQRWTGWLTGVRRYSAHTVKAYQSDMMAFVSFMQKHKGKDITLHDLKDISVQDLRAWLAQRRQDKCASTTLARAASAVRSFYCWADKQDIMHNTAALRFKTVPIKAPLPRALSIEAIDALLNKSDEDDGGSGLVDSAEIHFDSSDEHDGCDDYSAPMFRVRGGGVDNSAEHFTLNIKIKTRPTGNANE